LRRTPQQLLAKSSLPMRPSFIHLRECGPPSANISAIATPRAISSKPQENPMLIAANDLSPLVALIAGILILIIPRLLNFIVAIYLIFIGLVGLNSVHHWVNLH
jgi:hypothetical protein